MKSSPAPLRRIAALSVAITIFTATIASAQSLDTRPAPTKAPLLSPAAFSRLVHPPQTDLTQAPVVAEAPRPSLLRQATAVTAQQAQPLPPKPLKKFPTGLVVGILIAAVAVGLVFLVVDVRAES